MKKYKIAVLILIFGISLIIGYKKYLNNNQEEPILAFYNSDTNGWLDDIPKKGSNLIFEKAECDNDATVEWDKDNWAPIVLNLKASKIRCTLYFGKPMNDISKCGESGTNAATCIKNEASKDTTNLANDNTGDSNIRYIGKNPNNYVKFNNKLWRIIGVMNNIKTSASGVGESRLKIISVESYDDITGYRWDSEGSNDWASPASFNVALQGITEAKSNLIDNAVWNLGGFYMKDYYYEDETSPDSQPNIFYDAERSNNHYGNNATTWTGKVALMYPSDYGYAVGGNVRTACLKTNMTDFSMIDCPSNNWLFNSKSYFGQWTLTHDTYYSSAVFLISETGDLYNYSVTYDEAGIPEVFPVVYLKSSVKIISGFGTSDNPYELSL